MKEQQEMGDDLIYLEPGSVWRQEDEWRYFEKDQCGDAHWSMFGTDLLYYEKTHNWLAWAKHPDTVLVYSPSGNRLPTKPGYVRHIINAVVNERGQLRHASAFNNHATIRAVDDIETGRDLVIIVDAKLPVPQEPDTVEGVVVE